MPIERKPLFRPDVMHQHLVAFQLPEYIVTIRPSLMHWADLIASGRADKLNEKELLPDFLTDFFVDLLSLMIRQDQRFNFGTRPFIATLPLASPRCGIAACFFPRSWLPSEALTKPPK